MATAIGRCKGCKCVARVELVATTATVWRSVGIGMVGMPREQEKRTITVYTMPNGEKFSDGHCFAKCLCGRSVEFRRIAGRVTAHKCSAKCLSSTGHLCECACGGRNHGANHAA